jgi:hypothetical protein
MDIKLTELNWRIAAKIVLVELRQKLKTAEAENEFELDENPNYPLSSRQAVNEIEIDMLKTAINTLEMITL